MVSAEKGGIGAPGSHPFQTSGMGLPGSDALRPSHADTSISRTMRQRWFEADEHVQNLAALPQFFPSFSL
jgi:hypothetical protein